MTTFPIEKNEEDELPIPTVWREALKRLANALVFDTEYIPVSDILATSCNAKTKEIQAYNLETYPDAIGPLTDSTWENSIYRWDAGYWQVLLDLVTKEGEISDLVFHAKVRETESGYVIEPGLIYVP
jgi:hypothetical protein